MEEANKPKENGESGQLSRREKRMQRHCSEILEAAKTLFAANGYDGTSMQMIAEKAELSVGKLYMHFEGKEAIYIEIARELHQHLLQVSDDSCRPGMTKLEMLRARIRAIISLMNTERDFMRINREMNYNCSKMMDKMEKRDHTSILMRLLAEAVDEGEIEIGFDPAILSVMMEGGAMNYVDEFLDDEERIHLLPEYIDMIFLNQFETERNRSKREDTEENG